LNCCSRRKLEGIQESLPTFISLPLLLSVFSFAGGRIFFYILFDRILYIWNIVCMQLILRNQDDPRYKLNWDKPFKVYRNLHQDCWSLQQDSLVKAHAKTLKLFNCKFLVNERLRQKTIKEGRKNVHAFIKGYLSELFDSILDTVKGTAITYNPEKNEFFYEKESEASIHSADAVVLEERKVFSF
jgi:hypothetical protein